MLDKVDVQVPEWALPGVALSPLLQQLRHGSVPPFRPSRFYQFVGDLRKEHEIDAIVSLYYRYGKPAHKVEIVDAGKKSLGEMAEILLRLFEVDPWKLRIMRVDLAADVEGVPVYWFRDHARVNRKQFSSRISKARESELKFVSMGTATAQTLYAGKRPNLIRIYDKIAEWRRAWQRMERASQRFNAGMRGLGMSQEQLYYGQRIPPTFAEFCRAEGYEYSEGSILTRVERQIGGDRVPEQLTTLGDLRSAADYQPFQAIRIVGGQPIRPIGPPPEDLSVRDVLAALGLEALKQELGSAEQACAYVMKYGRGNGKRILESLKGAFPTERHSLTLQEIQEEYRKSTAPQTSQSAAPGNILTPYVWQSEADCRKQHWNSFESTDVQVDLNAPAI